MIFINQLTCEELKISHFFHIAATASCPQQHWERREVCQGWPDTCQSDTNCMYMAGGKRHARIRGVESCHHRGPFESSPGRTGGMLPLSALIAAQGSFTAPSYQGLFKHPTPQLPDRKLPRARVELEFSSSKCHGGENTVDPQ